MKVNVTPPSCPCHGPRLPPNQEISLCNSLPLARVTRFPSLFFAISVILDYLVFIPIVCGIMDFRTEKSQHWCRRAANRRQPIIMPGIYAHDPVSISIGAELIS